MLSVALKGIQIQAGHGFYAQEHVLGHHFEVDVKLFAEASLEQNFPYLDYSIIHRIVQNQFARQEKLLETLVRNIAMDLKNHFPICTKVQVTVRKRKPPLGGAVQFAEVSFEG